MIEEDEDELGLFRLNEDTVFELLAVGTIVGMRSPTNAIESFFIAEVTNKSVATENICDGYGHCVLAGECYAEVFYLQNKDENSSTVKYQRLKKAQHAYIHIAEIFVTNVALDEDLCMDKYEYQSILNGTL